MAVRWFKDGKLGPPIKKEIIKLKEKEEVVICKAYLKDSKYSFDGSIFFIGQLDMDGEYFHMLNEIDINGNHFFSDNIVPSKYFHSLTHKDIINIKLNNVWIISDQFISSLDNPISKWKFSELLESFGGEDNIKFYTKPEKHVYLSKPYGQFYYD